MLQRIRDRGVRSILLAAIAIALVPTTASAAQDYRLDPVLSLTGDCSESTVDPIPDPGCPGPNHPLQPFTSPRTVVTDFYGDIYVVSYGLLSAHGADGRIDVFGSDGSYIAEVLDTSGPENATVDSKGNLYVFEPGQIKLFEPSVYHPGSGEISYEKAPTIIANTGGVPVAGLAVNVDNDHLFFSLGTHICEFKAAAENNEEIDCTIGSGYLPVNSQGLGLAIDAKHHRVYASAKISTPSERYVIQVFELEPPHALLGSIDGSALPQGKFAEEPSVAVNEETGDIFTLTAEDIPHAVNRLTGDGAFIAQIGGDNGIKPAFREEIGIDNGQFSPNRGYLFVPSHPSGTGHSFAFGPSEECEPIIESLSFANVTVTEADLRAVVNPCGVTTSYTFEYTTQQAFEAEGFSNAQVAGQGQLPAVNFGNPISAPITGLQPDTAYRFRIRATNTIGSAEEEGSFSTYPLEVQPPCLNDSLRIGFSADLPDCRAYELVTPPDTNSRTPQGVGRPGAYFPSPQASPAGDKVSFITEGGSIPGLEGTGSLAGDSYLARRGASGWSTSAAGPTGVEASAPLSGSPSPDQEHSFWSSGGSPGSAGAQGVETTYVRYPDGHSSPVGRGSAATDGAAPGKLITENAGHIVFASSVHLEPAAPPTGTTAIYDRTADEVTHVVSLLPESKTPKAGEGADYQGASLDGRGVAFKVGGTLYLRRDNAKTYEVGSGVTFAGVAEGGGRIFYLEGGDLKALDVASGDRIDFASGGEVTPVNVASGGTAAYFVSPDVLSAQENPRGAKAELGEENLYLSREGAISFLGTVTERDVEGELRNIRFDGLGLWTWVVGPSADGEPGRFGADPSRSTPDGSALLFESRANLTGYESGEGEFAEVYLYDASGSLACLSCNPTGAPASGDASLESVNFELGAPGPFNPFALVRNLRDDGRRAFFQSTDRLVPSDTDGLQDVYEWEAQGVGTCSRIDGCVNLISSGSSSAPDYLYAVGESGNDVFFRSADLLLGADAAETPSIYDARVEGGFPEPPAPEPCEGEGCRSSLFPQPALSTPGKVANGAHDNVGGKRCPKVKRKVKRHGRVRCVKKKHPKHGHHRRAGAGRKGGAK